MDADTVTASNSHEQLLKRFEEEKIPILLGTQMVTKGLDFENVTLVGVLDADMSLYVSNYRAAETTFSLITQVVGRAGRGEQAGTAMVQTMTPEHPGHYNSRPDRTTTRFTRWKSPSGSFTTARRF